ncbi:DoxX family protein [Pseudomonas sp. HR96]|uniref:DoxX family protein n=1 Tax=Pseudomonas sp. HR96 TaxID=1027966 RepID=UPI002A748228|nr:DoxX family protein [Pseudomonas sp. HR96]WPO97703.1 DoxX family protein [Pseudomonas sp. HR96]
MRLALAAIYLTAGFFHLYATAGFVAIVPGWVPWPHSVVIVTGICEGFGALGLLLPRWRRLAALLLALYAVCVFPANLKHAFEHVALNGHVLGWGYHLPRLLLQPVLVWWPLFCTGGIDWPARRDVPG